MISEPQGSVEHKTGSSYARDDDTKKRKEKL
jgi:hypothetical protein